MKCWSRSKGTSVTGIIITFYFDFCCSNETNRAFYIGETRRSLSDRMNGHWFTSMVSNPDLQVAIHTQTTWVHPRSHLPPIWNCIPTRTPIPTSINPQIPPLPQQHLKFRLSLFYSNAEEGHCDLTKSLPFSFRFICICLSDAHLQARQRFCLS